MRVVGLGWPDGVGGELETRITRHGIILLLLRTAHTAAVLMGATGSFIFLLRGS